MTHRTQQHLDAIRAALFFEWDPIGVAADDDATGEYDAYAGAIYSLLSQHASADEVFDYLWQLETLHMGLPGSRQRTEAFAQRLLQLINEVEAESE